MNCRKCGKEIQTGYQFCPFCGVKEPIKEDKLVLRNTDWLRLATTEELEQFLQNLKFITAEELSAWCCGMHENICVYEIRVTYSWRYESQNGVVSHGTRSFSGLSAEDTAKETNKLISKNNGNDTRTLRSIDVKTRNLSNSFKAEESGKTWFRTREECEAAIIALRQEINGAF